MVNNQNIQKNIDSLIDKVFLRFIPHSIKPNHVTILRFVLIPIVCYFFTINRYDIALIIFVIAASTDFIDGAMARTRNQITDIGKVIDPVADKLLIASVLLFIGFDYFIIKIFVVAIAFEMITVLFSALFSFAVGRPIGANVYGKIKMVLQSVGAGFFIIGLMLNNELLVDLSIDVLVLAFIFAVLSAIEQIKIKLRK